jgi:AraC-like DNA-binding protein
LQLSSPLDGLSFKMLVACNVKCGRGWKLPPVSWPDHRLLVVRAGCGTLLHSAGNIPLRRGQIIFGLPGEVYGVSQDERRRLVVSVLRFELVGGQNCHSALPRRFRKSLCMEAADFSLLEQLVMRLVESVGKLPCLASGAGDAMLRTILWLLHDAPPHGGPANAGQIAFQELKPALEHRIAGGEHEPSIGELSRLCGMSENTFRRRMQACFGLSPTQYFMRRRMERAKQLLLETSHTIEAVSAELGYGETSHFCRQFKTFTGLSPSIFRTSHI